MSESGAVRRRRSRAEVEALVAEFEASGLMREAFCRQRDLAVGTLDQYRRRVHDGHPRRGPLLPVELVSSSRDSDARRKWDKPSGLSLAVRDAGGMAVFDFRMSRKREGPLNFLGNFEGLLQTDAYAAYDRVGGPKMVHATCRVDEDVAALVPHRPGRADFPHPVPHGRDSLPTVYW
jgi:Transposase IS66 family